MKISAKLITLNIRIRLIRPAVTFYWSAVVNKPFKPFKPFEPFKRFERLNLCKWL